MSSRVEKSTKTSKNFWKVVRDSKTQVIEPEVGRKIVFDELSVEVLWPEKNGQKTHQEERAKSTGISGKNASRASKKSEDTNAQSIVLRLEFGGFSALLTGDLEIPQEKTLITSGKLGHITVLKVGHHGSNTSTSEEFLEEITPSIAVIGVGKDNRYGHPVKRVIDLLEEKRIHVLRTDLDGRITLTTDGKTIKESTSGKSHGSVIR